MWRLYRKILAAGSVANAPWAGRTVTVTTPDNIETTALSYIEEAVRRLSTTSDISEHHFEHLE